LEAFLLFFYFFYFFFKKKEGKLQEKNQLKEEKMANSSPIASSQLPTPLILSATGNIQYMRITVGSVGDDTRHVFLVPALMAQTIPQIKELTDIQKMQEENSNEEDVEPEVQPLIIPQTVDYPDFEKIPFDWCMRRLFWRTRWWNSQDGMKVFPLASMSKHEKQATLLTAIVLGSNF
jgi:hypothetical protein